MLKCEITKLLSLTEKEQMENAMRIKDEAKGLAELIIAKQRKGPVGSIKLAWFADHLKFDDQSKRANPVYDNYTEDTF